MKRGYILGSDREDKLALLVAAGCRNDGYSIRVDELPVKERSKTLDEAYRQRRLAVEELRPGDDLYVADIFDLGPAPIEILKWVAGVYERGARLIVVTEKGEEVIEFTSPEGAVRVAVLAERLDEMYRRRQGKILADGRSASDAKTGPEGRFETDLKPHYDAIYAIWGTKKISRAKATELINLYLAERDLEPVKVSTLDKRLGAKTKAEAACMALSN